MNLANIAPGDHSHMSQAFLTVGSPGEIRHVAYTVRKFVKTSMGERSWKM